MNYLIKKGYGPNNATAINMLDGFGTANAIIMASKNEDFTKNLSHELKYVIHSENTNAIKVALFSIDFPKESEAASVLETLDTLLKERRIGDFTFPTDIIIMVSAWEEVYPELFSEESVTTRFNAKLIDFTSAKPEEMEAAFGKELKAITQTKGQQKRQKHEADDSLSR